MVKHFTPEEDAEVTKMQDELRSGWPIVTIAYRAGLKAGLRRAVKAAESAPPGQQVAAIMDVLNA